MDFKISLAAARVNADMTQGDVAKALNVTPNTVVNWEKGRSEPTAAQAVALGELFKLPLDRINFLPKKSITN